MDRKVRDYLIRAHTKVIAHYHQVLRRSSLPQEERERIQKRLSITETELKSLSGGALNVQELAA